MIVICINFLVIDLEGYVKLKYLKTIIIVILCALMLTACSSTKESAGFDTARNDGKYTIVTSFYPIYISALNVAKDIPDVEVINMARPQTGCLHDYQLSPADLKVLEDADAFVINGAGMEAFMDKVTSQLPKLDIIEASKGIEILGNEKGGEENPHVWVAISNCIIQVRNIGDQLAVKDPKHADLYKQNAEEYIKKLSEEKDKMHEALDNLTNKDIITFHEAFPYFAKEFGLNIVAVIEREPGSEPSAGELADIIDTINKTGVKALFAEPQYSPKSIDSIASQTGAKVYTLDPVVTGDEKPEYDAYIKTMDANLSSLLKALG
jgi:ABC-type metal ion transport system, periplasmic component/surface adhesin